MSSSSTRRRPPRHGGPRTGAGRPAAPDNQRKVTTSIRISPELRQYLATMPNVSQEIETIVRRTAAFRRWQETRGQQ